MEKKGTTRVPLLSMGLCGFCSHFSCYAGALGCETHAPQKMYVTWPMLHDWMTSNQFGIRLDILYYMTYNHATLWKDKESPP